jgi:hypothetical protein
MNKFLKKIFYENSGIHRAKQSPLMEAFDCKINCEFVPHKLQTAYHFKLQWIFEAWVNDNQENNKFVLEDIKAMAIKRLHHEIYGDIGAYLHELRLHLHNEDYENSKKVVDLIHECISVY